MWVVDVDERGRGRSEEGNEVRDEEVVAGEGGRGVLGDVLQMLRVACHFFRTNTFRRHSRAGKITDA